MLMETHRIEGIKFNFDRLSDDELVNIRGHLLTTHQRVTDEIGLVERTLFKRSQTELPIDSGRSNYERVLGRAVLDGEIDSQQAYMALEGYNG